MDVKGHQRRKRKRKHALFELIIPYLAHGDRLKSTVKEENRRNGLGTDQDHEFNLWSALELWVTYNFHSINTKSIVEALDNNIDLQELTGGL